VGATVGVSVGVVVGTFVGEKVGLDGGFPIESSSSRGNKVGYPVMISIVGLIVIPWYRVADVGGR